MTQATISAAGMSQETREQMSHELARLMADTFALYVKTLNCHWDVAGAASISPPHVFARQYTDLAKTANDIAERMHALGTHASSCHDEYGYDRTVDQLRESRPF